MRARHVWVVGAALVALAGCGSSEPAATPTAAKPTATWSAEQSTYLAEVAKLDKGLVANDQRAIRRAEETCADIKDGMKGDKLAERVAFRMTGGNATIDAEEAVKVIAVIKKHIC